MPSAAGLPSGFVTRSSSVSVQQEINALTLQLLRDGVLRPLTPNAEQDPQRYLMDTYTATWADLLAAPTGDLHLEVSRPFGVCALRLVVTPNRPRVTSLRRLRRDLDRVHRSLFGALMQHLRTALAPFDPIFTGQDAYEGMVMLHYGDSWHEDMSEWFSERHHNEATLPSDRELLRWVERQEHSTPKGLLKVYPWRSWAGDGALLRWLEVPEVRCLQGMDVLRSVLDALAAVPNWMRCEREWTNDRASVHPGRINVIVCQETCERDPVLECYWELDEYLGEPDDVDVGVEILQALNVCDAASHQEAVQYFQLLGSLQTQIDAMWAALAD
ncbi:hypothetical protein [Deinococcus ruber]|uniref:Uncharacterized protein n=1 Tax=Deinococcus ruber TaxID=1848197 RepID=A0A918F7U2_9DEIO|nr:hypothetical protein [Deinococcus ruber]GGR13493.1 hypothetical protein GCM10008957_28060 [Deinococcus ruber]